MSSTLPLSILKPISLSSPTYPFAWKAEAFSGCIFQGPGVCVGGDCSAERSCLPPCGFQYGFELGKKVIAAQCAFGMLGIRDASVETRDRVHRADGEFERLREVVRGPTQILSR
jgi:hypothetical protein